VILSQPDILREIKSGAIAFDPVLEESQYGQASVDLRLGFSFTQLKDLPGMKISVASGLSTLGKAGLWETMELEEQDEFGNRPTFCLNPRQFILAMTYEKITIPRNMIALVEGRSTYARMGLSMHQTAPWIQPGWSGPIVLEIMNNGPLSIELTPIIDRPCQLTFFQLTTPLPAKLGYGSRPTDVYQNQKHPIPQAKSPSKKPPNPSRR
jgi:dCTP deaminase